MGLAIVKISEIIDRNATEGSHDMRAIVWVETPGNGNETDTVLRFIPENPEYRPHDVHSMKSWFEAGWKVHAAGGMSALELEGGVNRKGVTRSVTALTLEHS